MSAYEDIQRYNKRRHERLVGRINMDWDDGRTLDEYTHKPNEAQSPMLNPESSVSDKPVDFQKERDEFARRVNSFRRRGNFGQLHSAILCAPDGCAISYNGEDWVKDADMWHPIEDKPMRAIDFAKKIMHDGTDVEYTEDGKAKASESVSKRIKDYLENKKHGELGQLLDSRAEGSVITIDGVDYRKDGYTKWVHEDVRLGSRGIAKRIDACGGRFDFRC